MPEDDNPIRRLVDQLIEMDKQPPEVKFKRNLKLAREMHTDWYRNQVRQHYLNHIKKWAEENGPASKKLALMEGELDSFEEEIDAAVEYWMEEHKDDIEKQCQEWAEKVSQAEPLTAWPTGNVGAMLGMFLHREGGE